MSNSGASLDSCFSASTEATAFGSMTSAVLHLPTAIAKAIADSDDALATVAGADACASAVREALCLISASSVAWHRRFSSSLSLLSFPQICRSPLRGCRFRACRRPGTRWRSRRPVHQCSPWRSRRLASTGCCRKRNASCRHPEWPLVAHPGPAIRTRRRCIPRSKRSPRPGNSSPRTSASTSGCVHLRPRRSRRCCPRSRRARPHCPRRRRRRHDHRRCPRCRQRPRARQCSPRRRRRCHRCPSFRPRRCRPFRRCYRRRRSRPPRRCCHPLRRCDHPRRRSRRPRQAPRFRWSTRTRRRDRLRHWRRPTIAISEATPQLEHNRRVKDVQVGLVPSRSRTISRISSTRDAVRSFVRGLTVGPGDPPGDSTTSHFLATLVGILRRVRLS